MSSTRFSAWSFFLVLISSLLIASCGGSSGGDISNDPPPDIARPLPNEPMPGPGPDPDVGTEPEPEPEPEPIIIKQTIELGIREEIEIRFDESINPDSVEVEGFLITLAAQPVWSEDNQKVTLRPVEGAWESGRHAVSGNLETAEGIPVILELLVNIRLGFDTFQKASFVIGQADFETSEWSSEPTSNSLFDPYGIPTVSGGRLWIPDLGNNRLLGFDGVPAQNQADATWVAGQPDFFSHDHGTSATEFWLPMMGLEHNGYFYMLEHRNNRVSIFDHDPPAAASNVIGQEDLDASLASCSASGLNSPAAMFIVNDKLLVADTENNRVLIWNSVPNNTDGTPADLVLGQNTMDRCARNDDDQNGAADRQPSPRTFHEPSGIWSDGERLVIADGKNNRVLIWNSFPASNFAPADVVLGHADFSSSRSSYPPTPASLSLPHAVWSNGLQLFVADLENNRVLIWDDFPVESFQPADKVLGQSDFESVEFPDDPSAATFSMPGGLVAHRDKLIVLDSFFDRVLIFEATEPSDE